tara:strand:- start:11414 stop:12220 length:807 start_codon:yes stop_codon:yes gene_type:complete
MKEKFIKLILEKLSSNEDNYSRQFLESNSEVGTRYLIVDDLLPEDLCNSIHSKFPSLDSMRFMNSFREKKYTTKNLSQSDSILRDITFAFQDVRVVALIESITSIRNQVPDDSLYAGGLSTMTFNNYLMPHLDNSHNEERSLYRTLNLLYYVTPNWKIEYGGNLQLWDSKVMKNVTIHSKFNRLVLMETNPSSWHSVDKVNTDGERSCVSNYYFSPISPTGNHYSNVTSFSALPDQKFLRLWSKIDAFGRQILRLLIPRGIGKKDTYE